MRKKGFTLLELLTVIIILGIVATIAIPNVLKSVRNGRKRAEEAQLEIIKKSAHDWALANTSCLVEDGDTVLTLGRLKYGAKYEDSLNCPDDLGGFIDAKIKNPRTKELFSDDMEIIIQNQGNQYLIYIGEMNEGEKPPVDPDPGPVLGDESKGNQPDLLNNMIPVKYNGTNWVYADTSQAWYDYDNKEWANAVVLNSGVTKSVGNTISESEIALWYVWIPRYKYKLFNANNESKSEQVIEIEFESGTATTGTVSCTTAANGTETCTNASNGNWYTHPAFTFGDKELTGFWVGKFENSTSEANCSYYASTTAMNDFNLAYYEQNYYDLTSGGIYSYEYCETVLPVVIRPNMTSWYGPSNSTFFTSIENLSTNYSINNGDSHMMKNMEWGAVAYLKQSEYGLGLTQIAANGTVYSNSSNDYTLVFTGGGPANSYKTNVEQSTTGNIYGIYDMSGGHAEAVMGNMINATGNFYSNTSEFSSAPDSKYYDRYSYDTSSHTSHERGKLGDATKETLKIFGSSPGEWYKNSSGNSSLPYSRSAWIVRDTEFSEISSGGTDLFSFHQCDGWFDAVTGMNSNVSRSILCRK